MNEDKLDAQTLSLVRAVFNELTIVNEPRPGDTRILLAFRAYARVQLDALAAAMRGSVEDVNTELEVMPKKLAELLSVPPQI